MKRIIGILCLLLAACLFGLSATAEAWLNTDIDGAVTDATPVVRPQDDFNLAVNRDYILNLSIPEGDSSAGGLNDVAQLADQMRLDAIQDDQLTGHDADLVHRYYDMLMDWDTRDRLGVSPAMPYVNELRAIDSLEDLTAWFADRRRGGITAFGDEEGSKGKTGCLFAYRVAASADDPGTRVLTITPITLSLRDAAEYREQTENGQIRKQSVTARWKALLGHLGFSEGEAARMIDNTFALEGLLAENQSDLETLTDPANVARRWNPTDLAGVEAMCGAFPAGRILAGLGLDRVNRYNVTQPGYMRALEDIYTEDNLGMLRDWLTVRTVEHYADYLERATRDDVIAAGADALGIQGAQSDEMQAMQCILNDLLVPMDNLYIARYCTPRLRDEIRDMIDAMIAGYRELLAEETWLSEATRNKAIEKLDNLTVRAVYPESPDPWDDFEFAAGGNLLEAVMDAWQYAQDRMLSKVNDPVDKSAWNRLVAPVSEANAYYDETDNSITIQAGILNGIAYQSDYSYEEKLGAIGVIIGHEISHAFDPDGAQYDKDGRLASWWTDADKAAFGARAKKLIEYYDGLVVVDGIRYSGNRVQAEAVADMGGMKCALRLAADTEGFDYQKFFEAYARLWAVCRIKSLEVNRARTDEHPLSYLRTNVTVMQFDEFQSAYGVRPGDGMYLAPEDRICVW